MVGSTGNSVVLPVPMPDTCTHMATFPMQASEDCTALLHSLFIETKLVKIVYEESVLKPAGTASWFPILSEILLGPFSFPP